MADNCWSSGFLKSRTWFVVPLFSVISYATYLLMFSMAAWQMRCMKHWVVIIPCNGQNLCETVATAVGESWNLVLLSVTVEATWFANVLSVARCVTRFDVSLTCHAVFEKIAGQVAWQITTIYQDFVMDTSVYLVSYDGLLVKTTTHKTVSLSLFTFLLCKNKN